jgi:hypothetical protein
MSDETISEWIEGLRTGTPDSRRLFCAAKLMSVEEPAVTQAYIQALKDPFEKVVQLACLQLGHRGGEDAVNALFQVLEHRSWRSRLGACRALITLKGANSQVVSVLEQMAQEPEAVEYNEFVREVEEMEQEPDYPEEMKTGCNRLGTILEEARQVAAGNGERSATHSGLNSLEHRDPG